MVETTVVHPNGYQISDWKGGKTRQLFIFPPFSQYSERTFDFRLSTATVELPESPFSELHDYHRCLMTLDEPINLYNTQLQQTKSLTPLTPYYFEGSDGIISYGTCTDINLIYSNQYQGHMRPISEGDKLMCCHTFQFIYALDDITAAFGDDIQIPLAAQELLIITKAPQETENIALSLTHSSKQDSLAIWVCLDSLSKGES